MSGSSSEGLDLSGKQIIKAQLADDIRRIPIHNEDMTYDELVLMMQRVFRGTLEPEDDLTLKYKDEDGDLVTIFDSSDLAFAIQCSRVLKLTILVNGIKPSHKTLTSVAVKRELREIRDKVTALLDSLDVTEASRLAAQVNNTAPEADQGALNTTLGIESVQSSGPLLAVASKEFDPLEPLTQKQKSPDVSSALSHQQQPPPACPPSPAASSVSAPSEGGDMSSDGSKTAPAPAAAAVAASPTPSGYPPQPQHQQHPQQTPGHPSGQQSQSQIPQSGQQPQQQQQQPQQQQQQQPQQQTGYPGYGAVGPSSAPQRGPFPNYRGFVPGRQAGMPPTSTAAAVSGTPVPSTQQHQQYYQQPMAYQGYPAPGSQGSAVYPGYQAAPQHFAAAPSFAPTGAAPGTATPPQRFGSPATPGYQQQWQQ